MRSLQKSSDELKVMTFRQLAQTDLFFLLTVVLGRTDADRDWIFERCREVQDAPDGYIDLWAREHYKSTIITFGLTIQDILNNPEVTVGIFSHTRPIAKGFLRQIKQEFETNDLLKSLFPDILWADPRKQAPKWSEDDGIVVRRKGNPKEQTVEAWGLVDGQPTSKHFKTVVYDDVVVPESVSTPDMIAKTTERWELSRNLTSEGGATRVIGTRYHYNDTYKPIMERGFDVRLYPATEDGTVDGAPVLLTSDRLAEKRREMGPYTFACQMLQDPKADETQGFKTDWLKHYSQTTRAGQNVFILVDPANSKRKESDYSSFWVVGCNGDQNLYALDMVRDRLNLSERADTLFKLHKKWKPTEPVGYEKYGMMADIEHIYDKQERDNYRFPITELGGSQPKPDRIKRLIPWFEQNRFYLPEKLYRTDYQGKTIELVTTFIEEEYKPFPVMLHDDMLDALSRMFDLFPGGLPFPDEDMDWEYYPYYYQD